MTFPRTFITIRINPDSAFTREGWSRKVKAIGGDYEHARGDVGYRRVELPACLEGLHLAAELLGEFPKRAWDCRSRKAYAYVRVLVEGLGYDHPESVCTKVFVRTHDQDGDSYSVRYNKIDEAVREMSDRVDAFVARKAQERAEKAAQERAERPAKLRSKIERLEAELAAARAELAELEQH